MRSRFTLIWFSSKRSHIILTLAVFFSILEIPWAIATLPKSDLNDKWKDW